MKFAKIKVPRIADTIVEQMEKLILDGVIKPGEKLPVERELSEQFNVSRASLREAIAILEARGLISSRRGEGTFVRDVMAPSLTEPLEELMQRHRGTVYDIIELRHGLEAVAAYYAAQRCTEDDRHIIGTAFERLRAAAVAGDEKEEAEADLGFHMAIAESAHNFALAHAMRSLFDLLRKEMGRGLGTLRAHPEKREALMAQHAAIHQAVLDRDPERARQAAHDHMTFIEKALRELEAVTEREAHARRRREMLETQATSA
ncbi:MAG: FCD domain-containing protein [Gammaproteobacteria bacterium]|nr:FCD domain-containing protein [Gammaproteobacteria bacterium]